MIMYKLLEFILIFYFCYDVFNNTTTKIITDIFYKLMSNNNNIKPNGYFETCMTVFNKLILNLTSFISNIIYNCYKHCTHIDKNYDLHKNLSKKNYICHTDVFNENFKIVENDDNIENYVIQNKNDITQLSDAVHSETIDDSYIIDDFDIVKKLNIDTIKEVNIDDIDFGENINQLLEKHKETQNMDNFVDVSNKTTIKIKVGKKKKE